MSVYMRTAWALHAYVYNMYMIFALAWIILWMHALFTPALAKHSQFRLFVAIIIISERAPINITSSWSSSFTTTATNDHHHHLGMITDKTQRFFLFFLYSVLRCSCTSPIFHCLERDTLRCAAVSRSACLGATCRHVRVCVRIRRHYLAHARTHAIRAADCDLFVSFPSILEIEIYVRETFWVGCVCVIVCLCAYFWACRHNNDYIHLRIRTSEWNREFSSCCVVAMEWIQCRSDTILSTIVIDIYCRSSDRNNSLEIWERFIVEIVVEKLWKFCGVICARGNMCVYLENVVCKHIILNRFRPSCVWL